MWTKYDGIGRTGIVAVVRGRSTASSAMVVELRADMDALPMAKTQRFLLEVVANRTMHGWQCDGHTAMLVSGALRLPPGTSMAFAVLVFPAGEEGCAGARVMMEDGLFDPFSRAIHLRHAQLARPMKPGDRQFE